MVVNYSLLSCAAFATGVQSSPIGAGYRGRLTRKVSNSGGFMKTFAKMLIAVGLTVVLSASAEKPATPEPDDLSTLFFHCGTMIGRGTLYLRDTDGLHSIEIQCGKSTDI